MRLKTYNADTVQAALKLARIELGEDAVLIGSNENSNSTTGAKLRVTFGTDFSDDEQPTIIPDAQSRAEPVDVTSNAPPVTPPPNEQPVWDELRRLRSDLDSIRAAPRQNGSVESAFTPVFENRLIGQLFVRLVTRGVSPALAARLAAELEAEAEPDDSYHSLLDRLYSRVRSLWRIRPQPVGDAGCGTVAVVGPAGAGKTSVLAKIAMLRGVALGKSLGFVCVDPYRVGGVDHLEAYAGLMDAPLRLVDRPEELPTVIDEIRSSTEAPDLLLLDTAGYSLKDSTSQRALHDALRHCGDLDVHLTVSATNRSEDIRRGFDAFGASANSMIFTRLDEASAPGSLLDESLRFGLPIAYVTAGQRTAHDLLPADPDELTMLAFGGVETESSLA